MPSGGTGCGEGFACVPVLLLFDRCLSRFFFQPQIAKGGSATPGRYSILHYNIIPVVPHKAVAEVSKIGNL